ncbi:hypothetical protein BU26DRAFT_522877 [Trematosphaeria pertusa]|uniref:Uncharacterized protein n=1 Tax=Trematosphaeria pertusa TaxID=390896 RepID=A0A6A6I3L8_9PLEO|nr:uncharacterized protein BU26DRAFT_522877 [Trematosphaeria pertusa]KAF2244180.1 hypothetical protein BU26DRAFT_522877 [Trematosphaeria pertusa]
MENGTTPQQHDGDDAVMSATHEVKRNGEGGTQLAHKRSISGSILGSLPFLRASAKDAAPRSPPKRDEHEGAKRGSSLASALSQSQGRKRKGSLRKSIMGKNMMRERRNSLLNQRSPAKAPAVDTPMAPALPDDDEPTPRRFSYENVALNSSSDSGWLPAGRLSVSTSTASSFAHDAPDDSTPRLLASPITSPTGPYASTTDDDEGLSFFRPSASSSSSSYNVAGLPPQGPVMSLQRRRSNRSGQHSSLTIVHTPADMALDDEWDYGETEWWGWVVLVVTWIVFVVVMGSCLGVWSWAWDVGETPYAPPELEDDPTLPITGYYPALMVCTAVMAWVWVVVAWVGMKYFRHAKVVGDDG